MKIRKWVTTYILFCICSVTLLKGQAVEVKAEEEINNIEHIDIEMEKEATINGYPLDNNALRIGADFYIDSREIFAKLGYQFSVTGSEATYTKGAEKVVISTKERFVKKSDVKIPHADEVFKINEQIYMSVPLAKRILPLRVEETRDTFTLQSINNPKGWLEYDLVAHALGSVEGKTETCSLEAFEESYKKGYRVFECDFILTKDEKLIARHDWTDWSFTKMHQVPPEDNFGAPLYLDEIKSMPIHNKYTAIDIDDVAEILTKYKDVYIITDTKYTDAASIEKQFKLIAEAAKNVDASILDRIIPQVYTEEMYHIVDGIHHFPSYLYTLYKETNSQEQIANFVKEKHIDAVVLPSERASESYVRFFRDKGIRTYTHTINSVEEMNQYKKMGIDGFYTDIVTPAEYKGK